MIAILCLYLKRMRGLATFSLFHIQLIANVTLFSEYQIESLIPVVLLVLTIRTIKKSKLFSTTKYPWEFLYIPPTRRLSKLKSSKMPRTETSVLGIIVQTITMNSLPTLPNSGLIKWFWFSPLRRIKKALTVAPSFWRGQYEPDADEMGTILGRFAERLWIQYRSDYSSFESFA